MIKYNFLYKILKDESTFNEWKIRQSIDLFIRIFSTISSQLYTISDISVSGNKAYDLSKYKFKLSILYILFVFCVDYLYFTLFFIIKYYVFEFNVWTPFGSMFESNRKIIVMLFVISLLWLHILPFYE